MRQRCFQQLQPHASSLVTIKLQSRSASLRSRILSPRTSLTQVARNTGPSPGWYNSFAQTVDSSALAEVSRTVLQPDGHCCGDSSWAKEHNLEKQGRASSQHPCTSPPSASRPARRMSHLCFRQPRAPKLTGPFPWGPAHHFPSINFKVVFYQKVS